MNKTEKYYPQVGDKLYLSQITGNCMVDMVKDPYTVIEVTKTSVSVQSAKLIFNGTRYYDTVADDILEDPEGNVLILHWYPTKGKWGIDKYRTGYPSFAFFGKWEHQPYLD